MAQISIAKYIADPFLGYIAEIREDREFDQVFVSCIHRGLKLIVANSEDYDLKEKKIKRGSPNLMIPYSIKEPFGNVFDHNRTILLGAGIRNRRKMIIEAILTYCIEEGVINLEQ